MRGRPPTPPADDCWRCQELAHFLPYQPSAERILEITGYSSAESLTRHLKQHGQPIPHAIRLAYNKQHQARKTRRRPVAA